MLLTAQFKAGLKQLKGSQPSCGSCIPWGKPEVSAPPATETTAPSLPEQFGVPMPAPRVSSQSVAQLRPASFVPTPCQQLLV